MQIPFFYSKGLDLSAFYHGTLNADLGSHSFQLMEPNYRFKDIKWSKDLPSETFSFYACEIKLSSERYLQVLDLLATPIYQTRI